MDRKLILLACFAGALQAQIVSPIFFQTPAGGGGGGFSHIHSITIQAAQVPSTQTNFPMYFGGTYAWLATVANGGQIVNTTTCCANTETVPADLIFTTDITCATKVPGWDIPMWTATTGKIAVFLNVPSMAVGSIIYACTGNSSVTTFQATYTATWDSNYKGVWHFGDGTTLDGHDSTSSANTCTQNNGVTAASPLLLTGGAAVFSRASSQYFGCGTGSSLHIPNGGLTMEAIFSEPGLPSSSQIPIILSNSGAFSNGYDMLQQPNSGSAPQELYGQIEKSGVQITTDLSFCITCAPVINRPYDLVTRYDGGGDGHFDLLRYDLAGLTLFNSTVTVSTTGLGTSTSAFEIGRNPSSVGFNLYWDGTLQEVRVSATSRSNDWFTTQFNNMAAPGTFYVVVSII